MTDVFEARVYPILATIHCILVGTRGSFPMHGGDRQAVWVASQVGQGCKAYQRADRQGRHPVTATSHQLLPGERGQSPRDHWVAASWQIIYASSQLRWCLFKCKGRTRLADSAAIHALGWTGGNHTHTHARTVILGKTLHAGFSFWSLIR